MRVMMSSGASKTAPPSNREIHINSMTSLRHLVVRHRSDGETAIILVVFFNECRSSVTIHAKISVLKNYFDMSQMMQISKSKDVVSQTILGDLRPPNRWIRCISK